MTEAVARPPSRRTGILLGALVLVAVVAVAVLVQDDDHGEPPSTSAVALGGDPMVRVANGGYTYTTTLRSLASETVTVDELTPLGRGLRPVTRAFVKPAGEADPPATNGEYAPSFVGLVLRPGQQVPIVVAGRPDCAAPEAVVAIRVVLRRGAVGGASSVVAPPRVADRARDLARLAEQACAR